MKIIKMFISILLIATSVILVTIELNNRSIFSSNNPDLPTANLIEVDFGPPYLRIEQIHQEATARFLIACVDGKLHWSAGIVTNPQVSSFHFKNAIRNYLEIDSTEILVEDKNKGASVINSALWINRYLDKTHISRLKTARTLSAWTEDGSDFRWGSHIEINKIQSEINKFIEKCK